MAQDPSQSRTEVASARRRQQARERGDVVYSAELATAVSMLATLGVLLTSGTWFWRNIAQLLRLQLASLDLTDLNTAQTVLLASTVGRFLVTVLGPMLAVAFCASVGIGIWQTGQNLSLEPLRPKLDKLQPNKGIARLFSLRTTARSAVMFIKVGILSLLVGMAVVSHHREWFATPVTEYENVMHTMGTVANHLCWLIMILFLVVAVADFAFQRWKYEQDLMMSKQEVKEERKEEDGDGQIRSMRRRRQRELLRQQIERDVPKATFVVRNPTHFAVALRYERGKMSAPQVVAKGQDLLALRIIQIANRHRVPVVEKPELARALFKSVKVGRNVPSHLFRAVAEIIAFIYRTHGQPVARPGRPGRDEGTPRRPAA